MTLKDMAIIVLKNADNPLSAKEILAIAEQEGLTKKLNAKGKHLYNTFTSILYTDSKRVKSVFLIHRGKPKKFSLLNE